jgi:hypothetical protein
MVGPAFFARWSLGNPKWIVSINAGVAHVYNQTKKVRKEHYYFAYIDEIFLIPSDFPRDEKMHYDRSGNTIGFTLSAGIRYQILPILGAGVSANGLFASISEMQLDISRKINRKINRIGVSAAIDFSF